MRFTPTSNCQIISAKIYSYTTRGDPRTCTLFIWDDNNGNIGTERAKQAFIPSKEAKWDTINFTTPISDSNDFWVGIFLIEQCYPMEWLGADASLDNSSRNKTKKIGDPWLSSPFWLHGDLMIRTIVEYGGVEDQDIDVAPDTLHFEATGEEKSLTTILESNDALPRPLGTMLIDTVKTMTVSNIGGQDLVVTNISSEESWVKSISPTNFTVMPGSSEVVTVVTDYAELANNTYYGHLSIASDDPDENPYLEPIKFIVNYVGTEETNFAKDTLLLVCHPTIYSYFTNISYTIPDMVKGKVSLKIYDTAGKLLKTIVDEEQRTGLHNLSVDMSKFGKGIYFVTLKTESKQISNKIIQIR